MPFILRDLPFFDQDSTVSFGGRHLRIKSHQPVLWVSIAEEGATSLHATTPRIPALFDTGCNHAFVIAERQLREWSGIAAGFLDDLAPLRVSGRGAWQLAANVWLHPNRPGHRDEFSDQPPFRLELPFGIAVVPEGQESEWPRLPLLGMRGLRRAKLHVSIDFEHGRLSVRTPRRFGLFM